MLSLRSLLWIVAVWMQKIASIDHETKIHHETVNVLQFTINYWRQGVEGIQPCGPHMKCEWTYSDNLQILRQKFHNVTSQIRSSRAHNVGKKRGRPLTLAVYNIHSWWERMKEHGPDLCSLPTTLNLAESEESRVRYHMLFDPTFKHFDGFSTTHPTSHIQRVYDGAFINSSQFIGPLHNFSYLIKAASYVAGDCHKRDNANANRDHYVYLLRKAGFRVEGLGRCMHTTNPEGITLPTNPEARYDMVVKKKAIGRFMFNMAFENSIEDGYVTEKPFDALISGTVPVYLGDAVHLKKLLPHPKAAIFIADYNGDMQALANYLNYLTRNETAYEEHRAWRRNFSYAENIKDKPLLQKPWECRVCEWAVANVHLRQKRARRACSGGGHHHDHDITSTIDVVDGSTANGSLSLPSSSSSVTSTTLPTTTAKSRRNLLATDPAGVGSGSDSQSRPHQLNHDNPSPEEIQHAKLILERAEKFSANRHRRDQHRGQGLRHHNRTAGMHGLGHGKNGTRGGKHGNGTRRGEKNFIINNSNNNNNNVNVIHQVPLRPTTSTTTATARPTQWKDDGWSIEALEAAVFNYVDGIDVDAMYPPYIKCILKVKENREFYLLLNRTANLIPDWDTMQSLDMHPTATRTITAKEMRKYFTIGPPLPKVIFDPRNRTKDTSYAPKDAFTPWPANIRFKGMDPVKELRI